MNAGRSQYALEGVVKDAQNTLALEQVSVYLPQLEKGAVTDKAGKFVIRNLPAGSYKLVASFIGYTTYSVSIIISSESDSLEIELQPSAIEMEEVILSTPFHKLQRENVMKVEQANLGDLRTGGSITLADGITKIPGVQSVSTGLGIGKPVIRGLSANRVLVYTQGIRLENQQFGDEHGLGLSEAGVESVEVIKGPASLLYGSDALGGVLYINPERFASEGQHESDLGLRYFTNTRGRAADAGFKGSGEHFKYLVRGALAGHTDYMDGNGFLVTNSRFREYDLKAGLGYQGGTVNTALRYNLNATEIGIPETIGEQSRERSPAFPFQHIDNHIISSETTVFFKDSNIKLNLGYTFNNREEYEDEEDGESPPPDGAIAPALHMKLSTFNYNLLYHLPRSEKLETIVGVQGMRQTNKNFGEEVLIPDATTTDIGILATSHLHFQGSDLQFGLRYDHRLLESPGNGQSGEEGFISPLDGKYDSFNAALGFRLDLGRYLIARLNLASGFRAPNLAELASNGVHEGTNRYEIGNPALKNEKNIQTDIAVEFKNEHFEAFIDCFYNKVADFVYLDPNGEIVDNNAVFLYEQQNASLYGGEIGLHIHPHPLDWLHIESGFELVRGTLGDGGFLPFIPAATLSNTLRIEFSRQNGALQNSYLFAGIDSTFSQERVSAFESPTPGYTLLNAGLGGSCTILGQSVNLRLTANNILDKNYISHLSRLKPDGIANIGRNVSLSARITF
jgi:iron complex outermembrane receptor protein